ncbi:MAG: hypothetical protein OEM96_08830, partial [Gemmatimonadota bacterium]|nr:hypothetical protein [Gemmatimonadota bacterium]
MKQIVLPLCACLTLIACSGSDDSVADDRRAVVDVVARGLTLEAPDSIRSGWTTFRFMNESPLTHFVVFERLPDGRTLEDSKRDVFPVFQDAMDLINQDRASEGFAQFERFPAWFPDVVFWGGPGFLGPFKTGVTTVRMDPGTYVLECYVKTAGRFHSVDGMAVQLIVAEEASAAPEPTASITLSLSAAGIDMQGAPIPGLHIVK